VGGQTVVRGRRLSFVSAGCRLWAVYVVHEWWVIVCGRWIVVCGPYTSFVGVVVVRGWGSDVCGQWVVVDEFSGVVCCSWVPG
jgi:hypothetical protein